MAEQPRKTRPGRAASAWAFLPILLNSVGASVWPGVTVLLTVSVGTAGKGEAARPPFGTRPQEQSVEQRRKFLLSWKLLGLSSSGLRGGCEVPDPRLFWVAPPSLSVALICMADAATSKGKPEEDRTGKALTFQGHRREGHTKLGYGPSFVHGHTLVQRSLGNGAFHWWPCPN